MGRVAVITGASRGIGAATALVLAEQGFRVVVNYGSSAEQADEVVRAATALRHGCATTQPNWFALLISSSPPGMCRDGCGRKASPGHTRCEECHRIWRAVVGGYDQ